MSSFIVPSRCACEAGPLLLETYSASKSQAIKRDSFSTAAEPDRSGPAAVERLEAQFQAELNSSRSTRTEHGVVGCRVRGLAGLAEGAFFRVGHVRNRIVHTVQDVEELRPEL